MAPRVARHRAVDAVQMTEQARRWLFGYTGDPHDFTDRTRLEYRATLWLCAAIAPFALLFYGWALFTLLVEAL
jgi:hypothetical protein